ncbi:MAG: fumarylacetoacetate hydrolase family protein [Acidobacteriia bacterium]|nr:fumarylacetoacetate hydrolase family protein [Terriglobia bacterium]
MKLCTFEVSTHLGRHQRAGACKTGVIVDLNFAVAWYMAQSGEPEPQRLADALVPSTMPAFLRAGLRAMHTAEELFLGAGPHPADWWRNNPAPRGPNDETLVYQADEVRLRAPLPGCRFAITAGTGDDLPSPGPDALWTPQIAAVGGSYVNPGSARRDLAGYALRLACGPHSAMGPYLVTPNDIKSPGSISVSMWINGEEWMRADAGALEGVLDARGGIRPGEIVTADLAGPAPLKPGDEVRLESDLLGALRNRVAQG